MEIVKRALSQTLRFVFLYVAMLVVLLGVVICAVPIVSFVAPYMSGAVTSIALGGVTSYAFQLLCFGILVCIALGFAIRNGRNKGT